MGLIEKLMGRRPKTSSNLATELAEQEAGIGASRARIVAAQEARKAAIEDFDEARLKAADDDIAAARRNVECRENAIEKLKVAHATALDAEEREAFRKEDATLALETEELADRIREEYPAAAAKIGQLVTALEANSAKRAWLAARGKKIGEPVTCGYAEDFRGISAKKWSATWPNPAGDGMIIGSVDDAPKGAITWVDGEPVANRPNVGVLFRGGGDAPLSLSHAVGDLPGLDALDAPYHVCRRGDVGALLALVQALE